MQLSSSIGGRILVTAAFSLYMDITALSQTERHILSDNFNHEEISGYDGGRN
jgi:hypothetical protein